MKATGTSLWQTPNTGATNESGFTALPGGYRYVDGNFDRINTAGYWWSTSISSNNFYISFYQGYDWSSGPGYILATKNGGFSVRCVKD